MSCSDGAPSARSKSTRIAGRCFSDDSGTACSPCSRSGMMPEPSTEERGVASWMSSLRDSHASRSAPPGNDGVPTTNGICGPKLSESYAIWDRSGACWRTYQGSLLTSTSDEYSQTWPKRGMMQRGMLFPLPKSEHRTCASASGSLRDRGQWPTPKAGDADFGLPRTSDRSVGKVTHLATAARYWPTPRAEERNQHNSQDDYVALSNAVRGGTATRPKWPTPHGMSPDGRSNGPSGNELGNAVNSYPTPSASMMTAADQEQARYAGNDPNRPTYEQAKYPTPHANAATGPGTQGRDGGRNLQTTVNGSLNPSWVEWLMGWPIGWTALEPLATDRFRSWLRSHGRDFPGCCDDG